MKQKPSKDLLHRLYVTQGLSVRQMTEQTGYSRSRLFALLDEYEIPRNKRIVHAAPENDVLVIEERPHGPTDHYHRIPDRDWLRARYWDDNLNVTDIGRELGVNPNSVTKALHRYGIPIKPRIACWRGRTQPSRWTNAQRRAIKARDGHRCRVCGSEENLDAHHIVPKRLGGKNAIENGITICDKCHADMGGTEVQWIGRLLELRGA